MNFYRPLGHFQQRLASRPWQTTRVMRWKRKSRRARYSLGSSCRRKGSDLARLAGDGAIATGDVEEGPKRREVSKPLDGMLQCPLLMLWTAPALRHRSAIDWLRQSQSDSRSVLKFWRNWRGHDDVMQTRSIRGSGEPAWVNASFECVLSIGTRSAQSIMAIGLTAAQTGRTHDRTRPMLQQRQKVLAKAAPSTPA